MTADFLVHIVDDDEAVRDSLLELLDSVGMKAIGLNSADAFLQHVNTDIAGCLVLDIRMPGMSGLDLQKKLNDMGSTLPVIFITGHADVPMAVEALKLGAVEFIQKPFREQELIDCIHAAMENVKISYDQITHKKRSRASCFTHRA